jgi:2-oxoisovalerate dehydrogenase E1 component alpha subunit
MAHERATRGEGPTLIEAVVHRLTSHSSDDDQRRYRDPAEVEDLKQHDPIPLFASRLTAVGLLTSELEEQYRAEVKAEINEASKRAEARPEPDVSTADRWVYAEVDS